MDAKDLKGRELAAYLSGMCASLAHAIDCGEDTNMTPEAYEALGLAAAEIERLVTFYGKDGPALLLHHGLATHQATRDAAALDECVAMWKRGLLAQRFVAIIERTGRKIGGP